MALTINVLGGTQITSNEAIQPGEFAIGVNLSGMEYGGAGAVQNKDYTVPTLAELQYYKSQGTDLIRLPISWTTLQTSLDGPLTASYVSNIETVLDNAASLGMKVIIDLHNYGSFDGSKIGTAAVSVRAFANVWQQMATAFAGNTGLGGYDLMNEPNNMPTATTWTDAAQAAITAIRKEDMTTPIYVEGNDYANSSNWSALNPGFATLNDPAHNLIFSAHVYLDEYDSGTNYDWQQQAALGSTTQTGVNRLENFVTWLKANNLKGDIGEIGVGDDNSAWLDALDNTLAYADANGLQTTYWAGGAWLGSYPMSVEPQNGVNAPQMAVLDKYSGNYDEVSVAALSGTATPSSTVYLSENDVLLATVQANAAGAWAYTLNGLSNGVHVIAARDSAPGIDGTIAATTFDLASSESASSVAAAPAKAATGLAASASQPASGRGQAGIADLRIGVVAPMSGTAAPKLGFLRPANTGSGETGTKAVQQPAALDAIFGQPLPAGGFWPEPSGAYASTFRQLPPAASVASFAADHDEFVPPMPHAHALVMSFMKHG